MEKHLFLLLALIFAAASAWAQTTLEVSQPVQLTNDTHYERGQSIVYDGTNYWLFYGRSASYLGNYGNGDPDLHDYVIYYKKASNVVDLTSATATLVSCTHNTQLYQGESDAAVFDGKVWVFGSYDASGTYNSSNDCDLYAWTTSDGGSNWTETQLITGMPDGAAHFASATCDSKLWLAYVIGGSWKSKYYNGSSWSSEYNILTSEGTGKFFVEGTDLYFVRARGAAQHLAQWNSGTTSWTEINSASETGAYDPTIIKVGSNYVWAYAPWVSPKQWIKAKVGSSISTLLSAGSPVNITSASYGANVWIDMWPIGFIDNGGIKYLLFTSERNPNDASSEITGNIWYLKVDWDVSNNHYTYIQNAVNAAASDNVVDVAAGTYTGNINVTKSLTITGNPGDATPGPGTNAPVIDGGSAPGDAFLIANGVTNVTIKGFEIRNFTSNANGIGNGISAWEATTSNITIQDNYFHNLGWNGVLVGNDGALGDHTNWLVKNNILETFKAYGFELTNASNSSIENNIIHSDLTSNPATCIMVDARKNESGIIIQNNLIDGPFNGGGFPVIFIFANSFETPNANLNNVTVQNNRISIAGTATNIYVYNYAGTGTVTGVTITNNYLSSLTTNTPAVIDAKNNYWGSVNGPTHVKNVFNMGSQGGTITVSTGGSVPVFCPWWKDISGNPGSYTGTSFAPITNNDIPSEYYSNFTDAIAGTMASGIVTAASGIYSEKFNITKSLTINGAKAGSDARTRNTSTGESILDGSGLSVPPYDAMMIANGVSNVVIDGFEIRDYAGSGSNGDGNAISSFPMSPNITGAQNVTVQNNYIHDIGYNGILVGSEDDNGTNMVVQTGWLIQKNKLSGFTYAGIELTNVINSQVKDNDIAAPTSLFNDPGDAGVGIEIAARSRSKPVTAGTNIEVSGNTVTGTFPTSSRAVINLLSRTYESTSNATLTGVTVSGNSISGATNVRAAVLAVAESRSDGPATISTLAITNNILNGNLCGVEIQDYVKTGSGTATHSAIAVTGNEIKNSTGIGLHLMTTTSAAGITVNNNKIFSNSLFGVKNEGSGILNATFNWWGASTGPAHTTLNPSGGGNAVSDNVSFIPWYCEEAMTTYCSPLTGGNDIINTNTGVQYADPGALAAALDAALDGHTLFIPGTASGTVVNISGKTVYIIGIPGTTSLTGGSPALTVNSGTLVVENVQLVTTTNDPTILVTGGNLKLRNCVITETTGGTQSCIKVTGGAVDAGTLADNGANRFVVSSTGNAFDYDNGGSGGEGTQYAIGNEWGSPTGPYEADRNPTGTGGAIVGADKAYVEFDPWTGPVTTISTVTLCLGIGTVDIPFKVTNFGSVGSIALTLTYNAGEFSNPVLKSGSLATGVAAWGNWLMSVSPPGQIVISTYAPTPGAAVTLADNSTLFELTFDVITTTTATLSFSENTQGTACEYGGPAPNYYPYADQPADGYYIAGGVVINNLSANTIAAAQTICSGVIPAGLTGSTVTGNPGIPTPVITYQWQSSADAAFTTPVNVGTDKDYAPPALYADTWYRRIATSTLNGVACSTTSTSVKITVNARKKISGAITYYNLANTVLTETNKTLKLYRGSVVDPDNLVGTINNAGGTYEFTDLCPDYNYFIVATSSATTAGSVNSTDAAQVNYWPTALYNIELVRYWAGDVFEYTGINATDAQKIQQHFVYGTAFGHTWSFWKTGESTVVNPPSPLASYPKVTLPVGSDVTANMYGLCMGDFNRSFNPAARTNHPTLQLIHDGIIYAGPGEKIELPLQLARASSIGAVSLIVNFPSDLAEVTDVVMNNAEGMFDWAVKGNELRIGWNSVTPISRSAASELVTLKMITTNAFTSGNIINIELALDPLNELADESYEVIEDAILVVNTIESAVGIDDLPATGRLGLSCYPNPFDEYTMIHYTLPFKGKVTLEIRNAVGRVVEVLADETQESGYHLARFNPDKLPQGIYTATVRLKGENDELMQTIKLVNNK